LKQKSFQGLESKKVKEENNDDKNNSSESFSVDSDNEKESLNKISIYENYLHEINSEGKMKTYWVKLIFKDIYFYKTKDSPMYKGMNNLSDVYIKTNDMYEYEGKNYYSFTIIFPKKQKHFI
jgi:hypothetical protein